jgi:hypothetical protein
LTEDSTVLLRAPLIRPVGGHAAPINIDTKIPAPEIGLTSALLATTAITITLTIRRKTKKELGPQVWNHEQLAAYGLPDSQLNYTWIPAGLAFG